MSHFINQCKHGVVVSQCKCPSNTKTVTIVPCVDEKACEERVAASAAPIEPPGSKDILDQIDAADADYDLSNAILVTEYEVGAVQVAGNNDDGTEVVMDALILFIKGSNNEEVELVFDILGWEQITNDAVKAVVDFAAHAAHEGDSSNG